MKVGIDMNSVLNHHGLSEEVKNVEETADIIIEHIEETKQTKGIILCPVCKIGTVFYEYKKSTGRVSGKCSNINCIDWIFYKKNK